MRKLLDWWPCLAGIIWLNVVEVFAGYPAAMFSGVTGLLVALLAFWDAGGKSKADAIPAPPAADAEVG